MQREQKEAARSFEIKGTRRLFLFSRAVLVLARYH